MRRHGIAMATLGLCATAIGAISLASPAPPARAAGGAAPPPARLVLATQKAHQMNVHAPETLGVAVSVHNIMRRKATFTMRAADLTGPQGKPAPGLVVLRWTPRRISVMGHAAHTVTVWLAPRPEVPLGTYEVRLQAWSSPAIPRRGRFGEVVLKFSVDRGS